MHVSSASEVTTVLLTPFCFYSKTGFRPSYCQISTDLDKILHTPIAVRNTLVGRLRPQSARGRLQAKPERLYFSVILVTHSKSYIETTDSRDFGGKPSKWRWGWVLSWKIPKFCSVGEARSKNSSFLVLGYPSTILRTAYRKQFYLKPMVPMESGESKGVPLLVWRVWGARALGRFTEVCRKVVTWQSRKLKICISTHVKKFTDSKNAILFDERRKIMKLSQKKTFQNSGVTRRLWTVGRLELTLIVNISF